MFFRWLKYFIQVAVFLTDFLLIAACAVFVFGINHNPGSAVFAIILIYCTYKTWRSAGGAGHWKKETRQQFYENWDSLMDDGYIEEK